MDTSFSLLIPVFNDWKCLSLLLRALDDELNQQHIPVDILVVDDASSVAISDELLVQNYKSIQQIHLLKLKRNLGHQRAIAIGLAYAEAHIPTKALVVMDGDGEDTPTDVLRLMEKCEEENYTKIIFARRSKRSESIYFKAFYVIYKLLYRVLTGQDINVGNFCIIPLQSLRRLTGVSEVWNHYAAGIMKSKIPFLTIPTARGTRLYGKSKMNFVALITHGLSAISIYGDIVGVRLLIASSFLILLSAIAILLVVAIRLTTNMAIPGWASYITIILLIGLLQAMMLSLVFIFVILNSRNNYSFLPERDYHYFILDVQTIFTQS